MMLAISIIAILGNVAIQYGYERDAPVPRKGFELAVILTASFVLTTMVWLVLYSVVTGVGGALIG